MGRDGFRRTGAKQRRVWWAVLPVIAAGLVGVGFWVGQPEPSETAPIAGEVAAPPGEVLAPTDVAPTDLAPTDALPPADVAPIDAPRPTSSRFNLSAAQLIPELTEGTRFEARCRERMLEALARRATGGQAAVSLRESEPAQDQPTLASRREAAQLAQFVEPGAVFTSQPRGTWVRMTFAGPDHQFGSCVVDVSGVWDYARGWVTSWDLVAGEYAMSGGEDAWRVIRTAPIRWEVLEDAIATANISTTTFLTYPHLTQETLAAVDGTVGSAVTQVLVHTFEGQTVVAQVAAGRFTAWWAGDWPVQQLVELFGASQASPPNLPSPLVSHYTLLLRDGSIRTEVRG